MIGDIRMLVSTVPFVPFVIHMADGRTIRVPTCEHISLSTARATVTQDNGSQDILPGLLMAGLTVDVPPNFLAAE